MGKFIGALLYFGTFNENYTSRGFYCYYISECVKTRSKRNTNLFICQQNLASYL